MSSRIEKDPATRRKKQIDSTVQLAASIVIATMNRADYLSMCLNALAGLQADSQSFEVIVIDNNSIDGTRSVVLDFAESHPEIAVRYIFEKRQGATIARNHGINEAKAEFIYFLDDDAVVYPDWLAVMQSGFEDSQIGCIGGPAILDYQGMEEPPWLRGDLKGLLSGYGLSYTEPTIIKEVGEYPFLCNMAIRKDVLEKVGLFRTDLGPHGNKLVVGEETELMDRIRAAGWQVLYLPDAKVRHLVSPGRLEKKYIYRSGKRLAVTHVYLTWDKRIHMILRWFASDLWYATRMLYRFLLAVATGKSLWFDDYMRFWMVAKRIPLRTRALLFGRDVIAVPGPGE